LVVIELQNTCRRQNACACATVQLLGDVLCHYCSWSSHRRHRLISVC